MSNPTDELYDLFSSWRGGLQEGRQNVANARGPQVIADTMRGLALISAIEGGVTALESEDFDGSFHREDIEDWRKQVLAYPHGWEKPTNPEIAHTTQSMRSLKTLGQLLKLAQRDRVRDIQISNVTEYLDGVRALLDDDVNLRPEFREYMEALVSAVENAMHHRDPDELREQLQHLWISVFAAAEASDEHSDEWRTFARKFAPDFFVQTMAGIASGAVIRAITGG